jgi:hypothetical protein
MDFTSTWQPVTPETTSIKPDDSPNKPSTRVNPIEDHRNNNNMTSSNTSTKQSNELATTSERNKTSVLSSPHPDPVVKAREMSFQKVTHQSPNKPKSTGMKSNGTFRFTEVSTWTIDVQMKKKMSS